MKKITILLCACAILAAGLFTSCKNETEYVDKTTAYQRYYYTVSGKVTTLRTTGTPTSPETDEYTYPIEDAYGYAYSEKVENATYYYTDYMYVYFSDPSVDATNKDDTTSSKGEYKKTTSYSQGFYLYKINGAYYLNWDGTYTKAKVTGALKDKQFKLFLEHEREDDRSDLGHDPKDDTDELHKYKVTYDLTFTKKTK